MLVFLPNAKLDYKCRKTLLFRPRRVGSESLSLMARLNQFSVRKLRFNQLVIV